MKSNTQLELRLGNHRRTARQRRLSRANFWFQRMRQVVDRAFDWQPVPVPPPSQIWFPETHRQIHLLSLPVPGHGAPKPADERQVCE